MVCLLGSSVRQSLRLELTLRASVFARASEWVRLLSELHSGSFLVVCELDRDLRAIWQVFDLPMDISTESVVFSDWEHQRVID